MNDEQNSLTASIADARELIHQFLSGKFDLLLNEEKDFARRCVLGSQPLITGLGDDFWRERDRAKYVPIFNQLLESDWDFENRSQFVRLFSWAIPSLESLHVLARYGPLVELGAGSGFWAYLLRNMGVNITPFDEFKFRRIYPFKRRWLPIREGGIEQLANYSDRTLFLCWPPMEDMATRALRVYPGRYVAYVGEGAGGCNADDSFFEGLGEGWHEVEHCHIPRWNAVRDYLVIYEREC